MSRRLLPLLVLSVLCSLGRTQPLQAEESAATDWSATTVRLRQELQRQPGRAMLRQQLAIALNNYGVELSDRKEWTAAVEQLSDAVELEPQNTQFRKNLATTYINQAQQLHQQHQTNDALAALEHALAADPNLAAAYQLRGQIEYDRQHLKEAKAAWQQSLQLDPRQDDVLTLLAQVSEELPVESKFDRLSQAYFDLRYEEQVERPAGFDVRDALLQARREVGGDFAYWPKHKIVVLLYSAESFRRLRQETPDWVGGQYDGKIRIPLPGATLNQDIVRQILFHEYTHAVVQELTRGRCPQWLNEGLAEYQGRTQAPGSLRFVRRAHQAGRLVPWQDLSSYFSVNLPMETVGLAYEQAHSIVSYLVDKYGFWRMRRLLKTLNEGQLFEAAFQAEYRLPIAKLEKAWLAWLPEWLTGQPA